MFFLKFAPMNKDNISHELQNLMEVIREQQELIISHTGKIPQIEIDILMGNVRKLYEALSDLNKLNESFIKQSPPTPAPDRHTHTDELIAHITTGNGDSHAVTDGKSHSTEIHHQETQTSEITNEISENSNSRHKQETHTHTTPNHIQPEALTAQLDTPVEEPREEISNEAVLPQAALAKERSREFSKPSSKAQTTATLFDEPTTMNPSAQASTSLYEKITAAKEDKSLATKLQKNPVSDLKKSIGINEKFSFINELFDGDLNAYNDAIEKLNSSSDHDAAVSFIQNDLISKYNWNGESESFLKLRNLVDRRFV
jgi:hypothetical protein